MSQGEETQKEKVTQLRGFKFSYKAFTNPNGFIETARKVCTCTAYPNFKSKYRIKRLTDSLEQELKNYYELRKDLEGLEADEYRKKEDELLAMEVDVAWAKLTQEEIECIPNISPADLYSLEFISDIKM